MWESFLDTAWRVAAETPPLLPRSEDEVRSIGDRLPVPAQRYAFCPPFTGPSLWEFPTLVIAVGLLTTTHVLCYRAVFCGGVSSPWERSRLPKAAIAAASKVEARTSPV